MGPMGPGWLPQRKGSRFAKASLYRPAGIDKARTPRRDASRRALSDPAPLCRRANHAIGEEVSDGCGVGGRHHA